MVFSALAGQCKHLFLQCFIPKAIHFDIVVCSLGVAAVSHKPHLKRIHYYYFYCSTTMILHFGKYLHFPAFYVTVALLLKLLRYIIESMSNLITLFRLSLSLAFCRTMCFCYPRWDCPGFMSCSLGFSSACTV